MPEASKSTPRELNSSSRQPVPTDPSEHQLRPPASRVPSERTQTPGATPRKDFRIPELGAGVNEMLDMVVSESARTCPELLCSGQQIKP
jgi:hypothetical protein